MRPGALVWPLLVLIALLAARRGLDHVEVRGHSMAPTLLPGDRLIVARLPARAGDVVLAADPRAPQRELIKRVASVDQHGVLLRGDNPGYSTDARTFGALAPGAVRWRAVVRYWPVGRIGRVAASPAPFTSFDVGGEPACTFPGAIIAGDPC
jgi:nickel-type superoxide dismutase maturation protease